MAWMRIRGMSLDRQWKGIEITYLDNFRISSSEDTLYFGVPECFDSEAEALAFCSGIGYGEDERATVERYPLRSCAPEDLPFIEAIEGR